MAPPTLPDEHLDPLPPLRREIALEAGGIRASLPWLIADRDALISEAQDGAVIAADGTSRGARRRVEGLRSGSEIAEIAGCTGIIATALADGERQR